MSKKDRGINPSLEKALSQLLEEVMKDPEASLTDKCKVIDRVLKLEQVKQKVADDGFGSGFLDGDEDE